MTPTPGSAVTDGGRFGLYLVLTDPVAGYEACTEAAVREDVRYVQLRMKEAARADRLRMARRLVALTRGTGTRLIVNDDVSVAAEADADGVHLGQTDMPLDEARRFWGGGRGKLFGLSTHGEADAARAALAAPDYIGVGPLFPTPTKRVPDPTLGLERAASIVRGSDLTCVAIGGLDGGRLPAVLAAGIVNFAVVRHVCSSASPRERIRELMALWRERCV